MLAAAMLNTAARMSGGQRTRRPAGAEPAPPPNNARTPS
jgi:hypothetical protein